MAILSGATSMKLGLTTAVAVLVASVAYHASAFGITSTLGQRRRRRRQEYYENVPPEILKNDNDEDDFICECREELILAVRLAQEGESLMCSANKSTITIEIIPTHHLSSVPSLMQRAKT